MSVSVKYTMIAISIGLSLAALAVVFVLPLLGPQRANDIQNTIPHSAQNSHNGAHVAPGFSVAEAHAPDLRVGQLAPTFELGSLDGDSTFDLRDFRNDKPVVMFFGSYT